MKINQGPKSSFGIPEDIREQMGRMEDVKQQADSVGVIPPVSEVPTEEKEVKKEPDYVDVTLKALGITITPDDFQQLIFKGYVEKEIEIVKGYLKGTYRTLNIKEWEEVDELLTKEVSDVQMTKDGMDVRKSMIAISYGVTHLNGRPVCPNIIRTAEEKIDSKKMSKERRNRFSEMAPSVVNIMLSQHASLCRVLDFISANPGEYLKNS